MYFYACGTRHVLDFDTDKDEEKYQFYGCMVMKQTLDTITAASFSLTRNNDGSRYFFMQDMRNIEFIKLNSSPTGGILNGDSTYRFERILGLL